MNPQQLLAERLAAQTELTTPRLLLRPYRESDADEVQQLLKCKEISDNTRSIPHPYPDGAARTWIATQATKWKNASGAIFAICLKNGPDKVLGAVGLELNANDENAELGYWLGRPYWGNGICSEAVRGIIRYGFENLQLQKIYASHFSGNLASGRVLEKAGLKREGLQRRHVKKNGRFEDIVLYGILRQQPPSQS